MLVVPAFFSNSKRLKHEHQRERKKKATDNAEHSWESAPEKEIEYKWK